MGRHVPEIVCGPAAFPERLRRSLPRTIRRNQHRVGAMRWNPRRQPPSGRKPLPRPYIRGDGVPPFHAGKELPARPAVKRATKTSDSSPDTLSPAPARTAFPLTHWSMVQGVGAISEAKAHSALETLCSQYWYPLYTFIRRQGRPHHDAEDCVQSFLAHLLASEALARARPERGRFRTFLLTALRNFLTNEWHRTQAARRGGGQEHLPLEFDAAQERFAREPADPGLTPEQAFDRKWATGMISHALAGLRAEYEVTGRRTLFATLVPMVWNNSGARPQAEIAKTLKMSTHAFTVALQRLRRRLGERLRSDVAQTVADETEVDAELRHLLGAIGGRASLAE